MFTKALIVDTPRQGDNVFKIRIPLFEDTTGTEIIYDALSCHPPGIFNGYSPGDCVYVSFEDGKMNIPVIMGRLYVEEQDDYAKGYFNNLEISNRAHLPLSTTFGDGLSISNLYNNMNYLMGIENLPPCDIGGIYSSTINKNPQRIYKNSSWTNIGQTTTSTGVIIYNWRRDT